MKSRRLFLRVLGSDVALEEALSVFIRINSGGRPVQEEEKAFSALVGKCETTNEWVEKIFGEVQKASPSAGAAPEGLPRDDAMTRMNERAFGFKLFVRVFVLAANYHTCRSVGSSSLSFSVLADRRFLDGLGENGRGKRGGSHDRLWEVTARTVVAMRRLLEERLHLDALQFLPETRSLTPLFLSLIKYPSLIVGTDLDGVNVRSDFASGLAELALLLLLNRPSNHKLMAWTAQLQQDHSDAATALGSLRRQLRLRKNDLAEALADANSLTNRYTLLAYGLERSKAARDFSYSKNGLVGPQFSQDERLLDESAKPEKQHLVPYSYLESAFNLQSKSRVGETEANNIGNISYISHAQNSWGGLSDELLELSKEPRQDNLDAHFISPSCLRAYNRVKELLEGEGEPSSRQVKTHYRKWTARRRRELAAGFDAWATALAEEWQRQEATRRSRGRIEAATPIANGATRGRALAHQLRTLALPDDVEDVLIDMFAKNGWEIVSTGEEQNGDISLRFQRGRTAIRHVELSSRRLELPQLGDLAPTAIDLTAPGAATELNGAARALARAEKQAGQERKRRKPRK